MQDRVAIFLAPGFEEIEAVTVIDVLRRTGRRHVTIVSIDDKELLVTGTHGITITADCLIRDLEPEEILMAVFPGGLPGATNLASSEITLSAARAVYDNDGYVAAICAAPIVLHAAGVLQGHRYTCYPSFEKKIGGNYINSRVEVDGRIITGCGPSASIEFALALAGVLTGKENSRQLARAMLVENA